MEPLAKLNEGEDGSCHPAYLKVARLVGKVAMEAPRALFNLFAAPAESDFTLQRCFHCSAG